MELVRIAHVAVLAASVLACPLRCSAWWGAADADGQRACSGCCRAHAEEPAGDAPSEHPDPHGDCECTNCFCRGALVKEGDDPAADDGTPHAALSIPPRGLFDSGRMAAPCRRVIDPPAGASGRAIRIRNASLLL